MKAIILVTEDAETPVVGWAVPAHWDADDVDRYVSGAEFDLAAVVEINEISERGVSP